MNLANKLTITRIVLTIVFVVALTLNHLEGLILALLTFIIAGISDLLDGKLARRFSIVTNFGILMDPLADKILICSAFIMFVQFQWIPGWIAVIIVARELIITGLRLLAASKNLLLAAEGYGKHKTFSQIVAIILILTKRILEKAEIDQFFNYSLVNRSWIDWLELLVIAWAVIMTVISGSIYLWRNRKLYIEDV